MNIYQILLIIYIMGTWFMACIYDYKKVRFDSVLAFWLIYVWPLSVWFVNLLPNDRKRKSKNYGK